MIVPPSPSKMKRATPVAVPCVTAKSVELPLKTIPVASALPFNPAGRFTVSACLVPVPS